jgi:hypothetical protein
VPSTSNCRDCGEPIQFLDGDKRPYDLTPRIHYANPAHIAVTRKAEGRALVRSVVAKSAKPSEARELAVAGLMALRYKVAEARDMLKDIPEGPPETMVLAALTKMGAE